MKNNKTLPIYDDKCTLNTNKRFGHVTDEVMSLFWRLNKLSGKTADYFPTNLHCRVMKMRHFSALGLVSRLFRSCSLPPCRKSTGYF